MAKSAGSKFKYSKYSKHKLVLLFFEALALNKY